MMTAIALELLFFVKLGSIFQKIVALGAGNRESGIGNREKVMKKLYKGFSNSYSFRRDYGALALPDAAGEFVKPLFCRNLLPSPKVGRGAGGEG